MAFGCPDERFLDRPFGWPEVSPGRDVWGNVQREQARVSLFHPFAPFIEV